MGEGRQGSGGSDYDHGDDHGGRVAAPLNRNPWSSTGFGATKPCGVAGTPAGSQVGWISCFVWGWASHPEQILQYPELFIALAGVHLAYIEQLPLQGRHALQTLDTENRPVGLSGFHGEKESLLVGVQRAE